MKTGNEPHRTVQATSSSAARVTSIEFRKSFPGHAHSMGTRLVSWLVSCFAPSWFSQTEHLLTPSLVPRLLPPPRNCGMTSFGWKRKRTLQTSAATEFAQGGELPEGEDLTEEGVDWLTAAKRRKALVLEDVSAKSKRLQKEGEVLAESERYWEALKYWDEALQLTPESATLYEMKSQVPFLVFTPSVLY